jgi:prepilin-type N-terminal cleavage/methylation domain-containing protein
MSRQNSPAPKLRLEELRPFDGEGGVALRRAVSPRLRGAWKSIRNPQFAIRNRRGLTLIEMLIAMAITLVMMAAVVTLFANISASIRNRRAMIELGGQLRQVRQRLALDLAGATCAAKTWQRPGENRGYIEYGEGPYSDMNPSALTDRDPSNGELDYTTSLVPSGGDPTIDLSTVTRQNINSPLAPAPGDKTNGRALGDWDDYLALTVRSQSEPFVAQVGGATVESNFAEVIWFADVLPVSAKSPDEPGMRRIYRRMKLIAPWLGPWQSTPPDNISVHIVPAGNNNTPPAQWVANTLGDLTKREYRIYRNPNATFPFPLDRSKFELEPQFLMLNDALAFDVRVYDPGAPLYEAPSSVRGGASLGIVQPGDPGWLSLVSQATTTTLVPASFGAYCDLGWGWNPLAATPYMIYQTAPAGAPTPLFNVPHMVGWHPAFQRKNTSNFDLTLVGYPAVYDTWSFHYENNGLDEESIAEQNLAGLVPRPTFDAWRKTYNGQPVIDQGTNGLDDDFVNGVDDAGERETSPPYDTPLRGIQVKLRVYERDARQVRETSVTNSFVQ